jgi:Na+-transporting methylmalonyl-CoA/oxaloacetate decarboxylase gamma subunit
MAEKLIFSLQIFFLGFSVVLVVLFLLYGLIELANRLRETVFGAKQVLPPEPLSAEPAGLPPALAAAIAAAISSYRESSSPGSRPVRFRVSMPPAKGSPWAAAGRRALLENSNLLERLRRK